MFIICVLSGGPLLALCPLFQIHSVAVPAADCSDATACRSEASDFVPTAVVVATSVLHKFVPSIHFCQSFGLGIIFGILFLEVG